MKKKSITINNIFLLLLLYFPFQCTKFLLVRYINTTFSIVIADIHIDDWIFSLSGDSNQYLLPESFKHIFFPYKFYLFSFFPLFTIFLFSTANTYYHKNRWKSNIENVQEQTNFHLMILKWTKCDYFFVVIFTLVLSFFWIFFLWLKYLYFVRVTGKKLQEVFQILFYEISVILQIHFHVINFYEIP